MNDMTDDTDRFSELSATIKDGLSEEFSTIKGSINELSKNMNLN